jgi:DNA-binding FadR family transcriptional regulator
LEARPGAGLFVRDFSFDPILDNLAYSIRFDIKQLSDLLEVRYHIEYGMVARVIEAVTPEQLQRLDGVLGQMREVAERGEYSAEHDQAFHRLLYETVGNSVLLKIMDIFWAIYQEAQNRVSMPEPVDPIDTYQRHVEILHALEARDVKAMQVAIELHRTGIDSRVRMLEQAQTALAEAHPLAANDRADEAKPMPALRASVGRGELGSL